MAATQYGTKMDVGVGFTGFTNYMAESYETGDVETSRVDQKDIDGVIVTRIVKQKMAKVTFGLAGKSGCAPITDFPKDTALTTPAAFSGYWVDDCRISRTEDVVKVSLTLTNLGLAVVS